MLNREPIATLSLYGLRSISLATPGFAMGFGPAESDNLQC